VVGAERSFLDGQCAAQAPLAGAEIAPLDVDRPRQPSVTPTS